MVIAKPRRKWRAVPRGLFFSLTPFALALLALGLYLGGPVGVVTHWASAPLTRWKNATKAALSAGEGPLAFRR